MNVVSTHQSIDDHLDAFLSFAAVFFADGVPGAVQVVDNLAKDHGHSFLKGIKDQDYIL